MTKGSLRYALALLFFANFLSYFDRQIVSVLQTDLESAFSMTREQFGYLVTAFTLGYMVFAPIVGFLTDRYKRTRLFAVCIFLWSLATIGSGLAGHTGSKAFLYATRFFIGIGEAGCLVIGPTLLSDYFSREVRGKALSAFFLALPLGGAAGYLLGAELAARFNWQNAFYCAGAPGFLVAALVWALVDPPRGGTEKGPSPDPHAPTGPLPKGIRPYLDLLRNRTLLFIILAQTFAVIFLQPLLHFGVEYFEVKYGFSKQVAARTLGTIAVIAGAAGSMLSGFLADRLAKRTRGAYALLSGIAFAASLPFLLTGFLVKDKMIALPAIGLGAFCYFLCMPAVNTHIANIVSPQQRAMAFGLAVFVLHLLGDMAAPPVFGRIADATGSTEKTFIGFSFSLLFASACCLIAARYAPREGKPPPPTDSSHPAPSPPG